jgi:hypothetical protein
MSVLRAICFIAGLWTLSACDANAQANWPVLYVKELRIDGDGNGTFTALTEEEAGAFVSGPNSSTANSLVLWNGTTGRLLKGSPLIVTEVSGGVLLDITSNASAPAVNIGSDSELEPGDTGFEIRRFQLGGSIVDVSTGLEVRASGAGIDTRIAGDSPVGATAYGLIAENEAVIGRGALIRGLVVSSGEVSETLEALDNGSALIDGQLRVVGDVVVNPGGLVVADGAEIQQLRFISGDQDEKVGLLSAPAIGSLSGESVSWSLPNKDGEVLVGTSFMQSLASSSDASGARGSLGLGSAALLNDTAFMFRPNVLEPPDTNAFNLTASQSGSLVFIPIFAEAANVYLPANPPNGTHFTIVSIGTNNLIAQGGDYFFDADYIVDLATSLYSNSNATLSIVYHEGNDPVWWVVGGNPSQWSNANP